MAASGGTLYWIVDGKDAPRAASPAIAAADATEALTWTSDGHRHWIRAEVKGPGGKLWLIGNPVYLNWSESNGCSGRTAGERSSMR